MDNVAVIFIDVQEAFVSGSWKSRYSIGEAKKLEESFDNCRKLLQTLSPEVPVLMTQCPFSDPKDMDFYESAKEIIKEREYPSINKYNNNIMDADGIQSWMNGVLEKQITKFVIGGCTITSCVRVSSINLRRCYNNDALQFIVDLSLCGARDDSYVKRCQSCMIRYRNGFSNTCGDCDKKGESLKSPVDIAVEKMEAEGVKVVKNFEWS